MKGREAIKMMCVCAVNHIIIISVGMTCPTARATRIRQEPTKDKRGARQMKVAEDAKRTMDCWARRPYKTAEVRTLAAKYGTAWTSGSPSSPHPESSLLTTGQRGSSGNMSSRGRLSAHSATRRAHSYVKQLQRC